MFPIPSLYQLSAQSVANYFIDGRYNHLDFSLNSKLSNSIFSLLKDNEKIDSPDILDQFSKKFACSKMDLSKVSISSEFTEMLKTQNLESISFGPITFSWNKLNPYDIISLITDSLNEVSRSQLRALKVSKWTKFGKEWDPSTIHSRESVELRAFLQLSRLLPSLETLDLSSSKISNLAFLVVCRCSWNLRTLNIRGCNEVNDLTGISSLKNLEVLILNGLRFYSHKDIEELFGLKKLRMLDISSCGPNVMEKYLECEKVLEELQFLECSGTDIDKRMVEKLIKTHKNLKEVAVLNTIIDFSVFPGINLLNCATAESILKALDYYTKIGDKSIVIRILVHIHSEYLQLFDEEKHGHLLENFLESVCKTIEKFKEDKEICTNGINSLVDIGKESVIKQLRPSSSYFLVNLLFELGSKWLKSISGVAHESIIKILDESLVLKHVPPSKARRICKYTINYLVYFWYAPVKEFSLLEKLWEKLSAPEQSELYKIPEFEKYLRVFFDYSIRNTYEYLKTNRKDLRFTLDLLCEVSNKNEGTCPPQTLVDLFKKYPNEWAERSKCIEIMANMRRNNRLKNEFSQIFLKEREFFMDLLDTNPKRADQAFHAMTILSLFMTSPLAQQNKKTFRDGINEEMTRIGRNFPLKLVSPRFFEPFLQENGCILRDVLQKSKHENGGAVMWTLIVIHGVLMEKDEKNLKILKNMRLFNALQGIKAKGIGNLGKKVAGLLKNL